MRQGIKSWNESLIGKEVECISRASGFSGVVGNRYFILKRYNSNQRVQVLVSDTQGGSSVGGWIYLYELSLTTITKDHCESMIEDAKKMIEEGETMLKIMEETGVDEIDSDVVKTYKIMKELKLGSFEQAIKITKIINS